MMLRSHSKIINRVAVSVKTAKNYIELCVKPFRELHLSSLTIYVTNMAVSLAHEERSKMTTSRSPVHRRAEI